MYFRHQTFRKYQDKLIKDVLKAIETNSCLLANAPTGLGKTDAVLGAALTKALEKNLVVFFLTPKISQHKIALEVIKGINEKYGLGIKAVDLVGRKYMCIHPSLLNLDHDNFYTMCKALREDEICSYYGKAVGYSKEEKITANLLKKELEKQNVYEFENLMEFGKKKEACPYELLISLTDSSTVIVGDYYHLFIKPVREVLLKKARKELEDSIIIVDEAHNLPSRLRANLSKTLTEFMLKRVDYELELVGGEKLGIVESFKEWVKSILKEKREATLSKEDFINFVEQNFEWENLKSYLEEAGVNYSKITRRNSFCLKVSSFLSLWEEEGGEVRIAKKSKYYSISKKLLDISSQANILNQAYSSIIMSGTLHPVEMYKDILGIKKPIMRAYPSPFPARNRLFIIQKGITTLYSKRGEELYKSYAEWIDKVFQASPGGVAVFFPSFEVLEGVSTFIKSNFLKQERKSTPSKNLLILKKFRSKKSLLLAVQGGSFSEGVDFNNGEIKVLIVAGLALEEMNIERKALVDFYEKKFKKGMDYGYIYPAVTKALQAAGRAIRREQDKAVILLMDERFRWSNYFKFLPPESYIITPNPIKYINEFFK